MVLNRFLLFGKKSKLQGVNDGVRYFILNGKDVVQVAIVTFGPDVIVVGAVDQLRRDPHPATSLAHAAFQHVADFQLPGNL